MDELKEGEITHKTEMLEMAFLKELGIEPNFADVSRHVEELLEPLMNEADWSEEINDLEIENEELCSNVSNLEDKLSSIESYVRRMRKQLDAMDFENKGEIEAILSDIEMEL